jgi:hypothetical protein
MNPINGISAAVAGGIRYNLYTAGEVIVIKWRDTAWKAALCFDAQSTIEYLMPDLAADMDTTREISSIQGMELFSEGSDSDKYMRETDVLFNIPMLGGKNGNVALFLEQQHEFDSDLPERIFQTYVRLREKLRIRTTCIVVYTGSAPNVSTYVETCYGCEVSMKYRTYYLPEKNADELRADNRPFARVMLAGRLSLDAGDDPRLREKYAMEILKTTTEQSYDKGKKFSILKFARRILRLSDPEISDSVKGEYKMQMIPVKEYAQMLELQAEAEEKALKMARKLLARGMPLPEVAEITELPIEDLHELVPH